MARSIDISRWGRGWNRPLVVSVETIRVHPRRTSSLNAQITLKTPAAATTPSPLAYNLQPMNLGRELASCIRFSGEIACFAPQPSGFSVFLERGDQDDGKSQVLRRARFFLAEMQLDLQDETSRIVRYHCRKILVAGVH